MSLTACHKGDTDDTQDVNKNTLIEIDYDNKVYTVELVEDSKNTFNIYIDGKLDRQISGNYTSDKMLKLPEPQTELDLAEVPIITENVYQGNLQDGSDYLNRLTSNGYNIVFKASTSKFIEVYVSNTSDVTVKRVIITPDYIIESEVDTIKDFRVEDYLF